MNSSSYVLEVSRQELMAALQQMSRMKRRHGTAWVTLSFIDGEFVFSLARFSTRAAAVGNWPERVHVRMAWLRKMADFLPEDDPTTVGYSKGLLSIGVAATHDVK